MIDGWKKVQVQDICTKGSSNIAQNKIEDNNGDYPLYGASGFLKCIDFYHQETPYIGIVKDGSGVGRVGFYPAKSSLLGTLQYILPKPGFDIRFVGYALKSLDLASYATGAAIPHIYFKDYGKDYVCVPPSLEEQKKVVAELDLLNSIIEKKNAQLQDIDILAKSFFYEMFGDPQTNELSWPSVKFKDAFRLKSGDGLKEKEFISGAFPVYVGNGISGYHNAFNKSGKHIIVGRVGAYCGNVRYVDDQFWLTDNAFDAYFDTSVFDYQFVCTLLNILDLHQFANHAAQPVISNSGLKELDVIMPPIEIQRLFNNKISFINNNKSLIEKSLVDIKTLVNSRMDYWFK